ncbi:MAG: ribonuclease E, partial [Deltaproteobacteria bacterium]
MPRQMFVNVKNEEESRIAILNDGLLEELSIDTSHDALIEGNIYKGKIERVVPGLEAVFVDFGREKNGFLAFHEIHPDYYKSGERKAENLRRGQEMMVQVKKGEIGDKGAALTTYVSIPGRYLVLMPLVAKRGVSKQIEDGKVRDKLRKAVDETSIPEGMGYIIRTAAELQTKQDIQRDVNYMLRLWKRVNDLSESAKAPAILYQESDIVIRTIRDYFTPDIKELLVDDALIYKRVKAFFSSVMPWNTSRVRYYEGNSPLFSKHNLEGQISSIHAEKVKLSSGGSIVIQRTEALVSVDVNSGAGTGAADIEKTATVTNMEAAAEVARQLRLRDLGGLIVIDFIDMRSSSNRTKVKKELVKSLKGDKARLDVGTISKFGLLEMSRQRLKSAQGTKLTSPCPICQGTGRLIATESFSLSVLRVVQAVLAKGKGVRSACVGVPVDTATFLMNRKRQSLRELELKFGAPVSIFAETALLPNQYYAEFFLGDRVRVETNLPTSFHLDRLAVKGTAIKPEYQVKTEKAEAMPASYTADHDEEVDTEDNGLEELQGEQQNGDDTPASRKKRRRRPRKKKSSANAAEPANQPENGDKLDEPAKTQLAGEGAV